MINIKFCCCYGLEICYVSGQFSFSYFGTFITLLKFLLSLAEFSKVKSCNLLSIFNLFLVGFNLSLKGSYKLRHSLLVLLIFINLECQLFTLSLASLEALVTFRSMYL